MTWLVMADGGEQWLTYAAEPVYSIGTLAHNLALINRFTGATRRPYSVAEHSLLCADLAAEAGLPTAAQLCCLMHDAHEAVTGDVSSPVKWLLGSAWSTFEHQHARRLRGWFGLQAAFAAYRETIKHIDLVALATERRDLLAWDPHTNHPWVILDTPGSEVLPAEVNLMRPERAHTSWEEWRDQFTRHYATLYKRVHEAELAPEATA